MRFCLFQTKVWTNKQQRVSITAQDLVYELRMELVNRLRPPHLTEQIHRTTPPERIRNDKDSLLRILSRATFHVRSFT